MNNELKEDIKAKVLQYLHHGKLETNKLEFKREWHKLKENNGLMEFLKDTTSIVNSYGGDDAFIVFGVNDIGKTSNEQILVGADISDSGYQDATDIKNIIDSNIDKPFRFDIDYIIVNEIKLCVLHLHPSTDKPHVIVRYKDERNNSHRNKIFIRSGSSKMEASKADLDRMYIERNSIVVERKAEISINFHSLTFSRSSNNNDNHSTFSLTRQVLIENRGTRVLPIYKIYLSFDIGEDKMNFVHTTQVEKPIIVDINTVIRGELKFICETDNDVQRGHKLNQLANRILENPKLGDVVCNFTLATGELLPVTLFMPNIHQLRPPVKGIRIA